MNKLEEGLRFGPLGESWVHLSIDMQRMFAEPTEWHTPWMERVLPNVIAIAELNPARTIFTRFIPPQSPDDVGGAWQRYYRRWETMTRGKLDFGLIELVPELARFVPPAKLEDKVVMSAWHGTLHARLRHASIDTLIISDFLEGLDIEEAARTRIATTYANTAHKRSHAATPDVEIGVL